MDALHLFKKGNNELLGKIGGTLCLKLSEESINISILHKTRNGTKEILLETQRGQPVTLKSISTLHKYLKAMKLKYDNVKIELV